ETFAELFGHEATVFPATGSGNDHDAPATGQHDFGKRVDLDVEMRRDILRWLTRDGAAQRRDWFFELLDGLRFDRVNGKLRICKGDGNRFFNRLLDRLVLGSG